jgi:predicted aldo/keto reductase-like oxidoreductase
MGLIPDNDIPHVIRILNLLVRRRLAEHLGVNCSHKKTMPATKGDGLQCMECGEPVEVIVFTRSV